MKLQEQDYYSGRDALSYNCAITIVCGERSLGKTYYFKRYGIKHFLETGHTFYYMRRYDEQIKAVLRKRDSFFSDVGAEFPGHVLRLNGRTMQIRDKRLPDKPENWEVCGYLIALSTYENEKSNQDANADLLIFDEFIKERKRVPYIENEVSAFYNLWETFDRRENRIKIVMLGNAADLTNPYFLEWGITITDEQPRFTRWRNKTILLEYCRASEAFNERSLQSNIYAVTKGSAYDDYARNNRFADLNDYFIAPAKPRGARHMFNLTFQGHDFGVYVQEQMGVWYVSSKTQNKKGKRTFALTREDMRPNLVMITRANTWLKIICKAYRCSFLYFESVKVRELFLHMMQMIGLLN